MPRIVIPSPEITAEKEIKITGQNAHYLINVMRLKEGDIFHILDGSGNIHRAEIISLKKKEIIAGIISRERINTESALGLVLVQALLKAEKMDHVVQKATELGVKEIYPVITSRTVVRSTERYRRWLRIAQESVKQCGRTEMPLIHEPIAFEEFFKKSGFMKDGIKGFIFYEGARKGLKELMAEADEKDKRPLMVYSITGPEGGFSQQEVELAASKGFIPAGLGPRILRAETAAVTALGLLQFLYGDLG